MVWKWIKNLIKINMTHTNQNRPSNLYCAKIWCILLQKQSQWPHFKFGTMTSTCLWRVACPYSDWYKLNSWQKHLLRQKLEERNILLEHMYVCPHIVSLQFRSQSIPETSYSKSVDTHSWIDPSPIRASKLLLISSFDLSLFHYSQDALMS